MEEQKIKITVQRGEEGAPGVVEFDEFVLIGWDENADGSTRVLTQTSAPPGENGGHLLLAARSLAKAMQKSMSPAAQAIGVVMDNSIESGLAHIQSAMDGERVN